MAVGGLAAGVSGLEAGPPASHPTSAATSRPSTQPASQPTPQPANPAPWWLGPGYRRSQIVQVTSPQVLHGPDVDETALEEMLSMGVRVLTGSGSVSEAWRAILGRATRIVLKFNQVGADVLATNEPMARVLVGLLAHAGYGGDQIVLVEVCDPAVGGLATLRPTPGWGGSIPVGGTTQEVANYLYEADALINVPFLKTHHIAGMSGAMKNLSHALIRHPAQCHANACAPYVGQVVGNKEVSARLRLNIVNALRTVARNGPDATVADTVQCGGLLLGFDPVAVDTVGHELLLAQRRKLGIDKVFDVPYLDAAAADGVGRRALHELECIPVVHGV